MAKNYEVGKSYYMPVNICADKCDGSMFPIVIEFDDGENKIYNSVKDDHGILLTAQEIAANFRRKVDREKEERFEELERENQELKDENGKLTARVDELEAELNNAKALNEFAVKAEQNRENLIKEQRELMKKYSVVIDVLIDRIVALRKGENNG